MKFLPGLTLVLTLLASDLHASTVLYVQNFENPTGFVNDGGDINVLRPVNQLYGNQPPGFTFAQTYTVETLLVGGTQAWYGTGFLDPQGIAGRHTLGMLSNVQDDLLALSFDLGPFRYLNFRLDISSIDVNTWGGPFFSTTPTFRFTLFDNPGGATGLGSGTILSTVDFTGKPSSSNTFDWVNAVIGLDAAGNTNGKVTLRIDLIAGGYAAMDNFVIAASDRIGDVPAVPEPSAWISLATGLILAGRFMRIRR